jgi:hypothetical protein
MRNAESRNRKEHHSTRVERETLESRVTRKCPARFGEGPTEKVRQRNLAGGLLYP